MQAVNLLPAYARPSSRWATIGKDFSPAQVIRVGGATAAACAIALGGLYLYERSVVNDRHAKLADTQARLAAIEATAAPLRTAEAASTSRATVVRTVVGSRVAWERVLHDLSRVLPDQVFLQNLQSQSPTPAAAPAAGTTSTSFTIVGTTTSHVRVALVLDRLALVPWLSGLTLQSSTHASAGDQFSIAAYFSAAGDAK